MSEELAKLAEALSKAQGELEHAKKDTNNPFYKSKYADLASVIDVARPVLRKNGLAVVQAPFYQDGVTFLKTILLHSGGGSIEGCYPIKPVKDDPQGMGSAMTYARRYCFAAIVGIAQEDDDGNAASAKTQQEIVLFKTASARKEYVTNAINALKGCETIKELQDAFALYLPKLKEMQASSNEHDNLGYEEIIKAKDLQKIKIQDANHFEQLKQDFAERK